MHIMGYRQSNAAVAYDMQPSAAFAGAAQQAPREDARPSLSVVAGEGRQADQQVSPVFLTVIKVFCALAVLFCLVGVARVALASATATVLNGNAELSSSLDTGRSESSDLEVMHSVYSSPTRVRDLATDMFGMVDSDGTVTVDLSSGTATATGAAAAAATDAE